MRLGGLVAACVLICCTRPTAPPAPPSNRAAPARVDTCPRDFSWFGRIRYLRYSQFAHGHFGEWRFHADFYRLEGEVKLSGVASGSYRQHEGAPVRGETVAVEIATADATKLLTELRDGIATPSDDREGVVMIDTSRSVVISIEAMAFDPRVGRHPNFHVELYTDDGETQPQEWNIRGCNYDPPLAARRIVQHLTEQFAKTIGNDAMLQQLSNPP